MSACRAAVSLVVVGMASLGVSSCVTSATSQRMERPSVGVATTAPIESVSAPAQQVGGQAVGVQAQATAQTDDVSVTGIAAGYQSNFGVGAVLVVSVALVLTLILSHRREMARILRNHV